MTSNVEPIAADGSNSALDGEPGIPQVTQPRKVRVSWKGILAVVMLLLSLVAVTAMSINRAFSNSKGADEEASKKAGERPAAAATQTRSLDMTLPPPEKASAPAPASPPIVPAIVPTAAAEALPDPIGVRRHPSGGPTAAQRMLPEDAPVLLVSGSPKSSATPQRTHVSTTASDAAQAPDSEADPLEATQRNLEAYQRQLRGLLDTMSRSVPGEGNPAQTPPPAAASPAAGLGQSVGAPSLDLFGGQLQGSATSRVAAGVLGNRSLTLPKGTSFTCALKTRVVSATSGFVGCQVQRNVYSDDGRVLLVERGSHMDGEYRITSVRPGTVRIPVLWTRVRTPNGVTVELDSPGTGPLGESGIEGHVDNRWGSRIGAALLLSLIDDSVKLVIQNQATDRQADTIVLPSTTDSTSKLAEKVLESTINIPPLIYQNQGGIVGVYVARDVDFSGVYELKAVSR